MRLYLIGDVQGCYAALNQLLTTIDFSPSRDKLVLLGDLVNRGPDSLGVLRLLHGLGDAAHCLLGNHDLHALAVATGVRPAHKHDTLAPLMAAQDAPALLDWLRRRPLALQLGGYLMVHAGVLPQWTAQQTLAYGAEVSSALQSANYTEFLRHMYGNAPAQWSDSLQDGANPQDRLRVIVNALTRLRFCTANGVMDFASKEGAGNAPEGYMPWFDVPGRLTADTPIAFGHWSTLGLLQRPDLLSLDTGCVWGGCLSAMRVDGGRRELVQVPCEQAVKPFK
jgi:bis(5'-nucleosyl)-tetraphosphatase (symmetrical)